MVVSHFILIFDRDKINGFIAGGRLCVALRSEEIFVFFTSNQLKNRSPTVQPLGYTSVGTTSAHPDTLSCINCHIIVFVSPSTYTDGKWIRFYRIEISDAVFIEGEKQKVIAKFISTPILFRKGYPG